MKILLKQLTIALLIILTGCATPQVYNPDELDKKSLSRVFSDSGELFIYTADYSAWILYIYDLDNNELTKRRIGSTYINDISLPPGTYYFHVFCKNQWYQASPSAYFRLEAAKNYEITCEEGERDGNTFFNKGSHSIVHLKIKEL
ncbi:hypothetical protein J7384_16695 [Endozoicomonas sp. G2_1]|uniref:hypothetical protein n=1 Tax=Endozoicomonas sp. G2_1 TaxID=2821091 RepID=UPI001ADC3F87|nr:hypothetical protein [Endozoicomonas sp. G2_1]MBO9492001.1 hypothetical protein [Endozoicomonas sp. G2_1]